MREPIGKVFRWMTTNGLLLSIGTLERFVEAASDKVHDSLHVPERKSEVDRVSRQVHERAGNARRWGLSIERPS